ncbi:MULTISPECIES: hypothetical protein [unclassified Streptomyces]|uniref:hypothetical protein n=1 Tax=unclassified Streptomyces TaxID=2593676 RepID=UPI0014388E46|nr:MULTISPECIES: hypothetical protein [unclassified Streptomyces]NJA56602.1 hypothetical protein [Streptomyces sp. NEAU-H3]WEH31413.1 hypothetical protein P0D76_30975 [Streptomyces sp. AM 3-1-1]
MNEAPTDDLVNALAALRDSGGHDPADAATIDSDLERGHKAARLRRRRRTAGAGLAIAVVAAAASAAVMTGPGDRHGSEASPLTPAQTSRSAPSATTGRPSQVLQLVAYTGSQPTGFRVRSVPSGWSVSWSDQCSFVATPPGVSLPQSNEEVHFDHAIAVTLDGGPPARTKGFTKVTVQGRTGWLGPTADKGAELLLFPDGKSRTVAVQFPAEAGLTHQQMISFAQGVTPTSHSCLSFG